MEINSRLQNQLNQEKNDMQMKSEELNILIRSCATQPLICIGNVTRKSKNKPLLRFFFCQMFQGLPAAAGKQAGAEKTSRGCERGEENGDLLCPGPLVPDWGGRPTWHRRAGAPEIHVQQSTLPGSVNVFTSVCRIKCNKVLQPALDVKDKL